jgi:hypothetical protein
MNINLKTMNNKTKLRKIAQYQIQNFGNWHELTCGNDCQHLPLVGKEVNGKVILACLECDYEQDYIPEEIFK